MKQIYKIHVDLPDNFVNHKVIGLNSEIILAGYLEFPADETQNMRVEIRVPFYGVEQGQRFERILTGE